jgi:adenine-specific DNA methylase
MSLIDSGFTVAATHTITSEMTQRISMQNRASADSTLLLTCRKPTDGSQRQSSPTLWDDIRNRTHDAAKEQATNLLDSDLNLTKTDVIIGAFGPTLQVFTEFYPVVDKHDNPVRPKQALEEARTAVVEVLVDRELESSLDSVDSLTTWYILSWLVYERETIPYDDARQLGLGVGIDVDEIKRKTKIWGKSGEKLILKDSDYRVQDYTALESGEKRRKRAYSVDPRENSFDYTIDAVHAAINVIDTKGSKFAWNWLNERELQDNVSFKQTIKSLLQVLPKDYDDHSRLINLVSGETGELLDIDTRTLNRPRANGGNRTTLDDF